LKAGPKKKTAGISPAVFFKAKTLFDDLASASAVRTATVETTAPSTVETPAAAAVEASAPLKVPSASEVRIPAAIEASPGVSPIYIGASIICTASVKTASAIIAAVIEATTIVSTAAIKSAAVVSMEPGACADEDAVNEVVRAVETVWRTSIGCVIVVSVSANGCRTVTVAAADPDSDGNLGVRITRCKHAYCK
jgi:hypothetical protein